MTNGFILPFKVIRNQAFRLYFKNFESFDSVYGDTPAVITIIKDFNFRSVATNTVQTIDAQQSDYAIDYLDLEADELNAKVVVIDMHYGGGSGHHGNDKVFIIYTDDFDGFESSGSGGGISLDDVIPNTNHQPSSNPTIGEALTLVYKVIFKNKNRRW